jgi:hypothetical protein
LTIILDSSTHLVIHHNHTTTTLFLLQLLTRSLTTGTVSHAITGSCSTFDLGSELSTCVPERASTLPPSFEWKTKTAERVGLRLNNKHTLGIYLVCFLHLGEELYTHLSSLPAALRQICGVESVDGKQLSLSTRRVDWSISERFSRPKSTISILVLRSLRTQLSSCYPIPRRTHNERGTSATYISFPCSL